MSKPPLLPSGSITRKGSALSAVAAAIGNALDVSSRNAEGVLEKLRPKLPKHRPALDQEDAGACVGLGTANWCNAWPNMQQWKQNDGFLLWLLTKRRDMWPDNDDDWEQGTDPEIALSILRHVGAIKGDIWTLGITAMKGLQKAAKKAPVMIATPWFEGMDKPDPKTAQITATGNYRGDHWTVILYWEGPWSVWFNSWPSYEPWGRHGSLAIMHRKDVRKLFAQGAMAYNPEKVRGYKEPEMLRRICAERGVELQ